MPEARGLGRLFGASCSRRHCRNIGVAGPPGVPHPWKGAMVRCASFPPFPKFFRLPQGSACPLTVRDRVGEASSFHNLNLFEMDGREAEDPGKEGYPAARPAGGSAAGGAGGCHGGEPCAAPFLERSPPPCHECPAVPSFPTVTTQTVLVKPAEAVTNRIHGFIAEVRGAVYAVFPR